MSDERRTPSISGWSYRIIRHPNGGIDGDWYEVHEVYFDPDGRPCGYCDATLGGDDETDLREVLAMMASALTRPVIDATEFPSPPAQAAVPAVPPFPDTP